MGVEEAPSTAVLNYSLKAAFTAKRFLGPSTCIQVKGLKLSPGSVIANFPAFHTARLRGTL